MSSAYKYQQTSVYGVCEEEMNHNDSKCACFWDYLIPFTRFWGVFTSVVLCGVGVDISLHNHTFGIYLVVAAIIVFALEITWAVTLFLQVCIRNVEDHLVYKCWDVFLWCGLWKRSILYTAIAVILFLKPHRLWLSIVAGIQLVLLAVCYLALTGRSHLHRRHSGRLLVSQTPSLEDRFEDITEILDDSLPGPVISDTLSPLEQEPILDI